MKGFAK